MKNPKGYSLIELIVVVAILAIVGTAVFGFFLTSSRLYKNDSDEVNLQYESQLAVNQLENLLIDATTAVSYTYSNGGTPVYITSDAQIPASATQTTLTIYNIVENIDNSGNITENYEIYNVIWKEKCLFLSKETIDSNGVRKKGEEVKMAEYVEEFGVSLDKARQKNEIDFKIRFLIGNNECNNEKNVKVRNHFIINKDIGEVFPKLSGLVKEKSGDVKGSVSL